MKAIVYTRYGSPDVLQFKEVEKPIPQAAKVGHRHVTVTLPVAGNRHLGKWLPNSTEVGMPEVIKIRMCPVPTSEFRV